MTTNYPGAKDTFTIKQDNNGEKVAAADVNNLQDSVSALEQTVGYGGTQPTATPTAGAIAKWDSNKGLSAAAFIPQGLTGAIAASRYVGATTSGAPTTGTFAVGDWVIDIANVMIWVCTTAGSPGTWTSRTTPIDTWNVPTLLNGWTNYGSGFSTVAYRKDASGYVHTKGVIANGTATSGTSIFQYPAGYRPLENKMFAISSGGTPNATLELTSTGILEINAGVSASTYTSLDSIPPFLAAQ